MPSVVLGMTTVADVLTTQEMRELSALFSDLARNIHSLSPHQTQVMMEVDEHMRGDQLTKTDLERLRALSTNHHAR